MRFDQYIYIQLDERDDGFIRKRGWSQLMHVVVIVDINL